MPQVEISIGGRSFDVACQEGEEHFLQTAAKMLDEEAQHISAQVGRMPEARMLLMAGLMLADKTASLEERQSSNDTRVARLQARIDELEAAGTAAPAVSSEPVEVPVVPSGLADAMAQIAARAEAIAGVVEERVGEGQA
ncbi:MAG: cell division protein ZapA [Pseudomonadota bacterium]